MENGFVKETEVIIEETFLIELSVTTRVTITTSGIIGDLGHNPQDPPEPSREEDNWTLEQNGEVANDVEPEVVITREPPVSASDMAKRSGVNGQKADNDEINESVKIKNNFSNM